MLKMNKSFVYIPDKISLILIQNSLIILSKNKKYSYPLINRFFFKKEKKRLYIENKKNWLGKVKNKKAILGLSQSILFQSLLGIQIGYLCNLDIIGIGYNVSLDNNNLVFKLGYSHFIKVEIPRYLKISLQGPRKIKVEGVNYQKIYNFLALIQKFKSPSVYKKKGLYIQNKVEPKIKQGKKS